MADDSSDSLRNEPERNSAPEGFAPAPHEVGSLERQCDTWGDTAFRKNWFCHSLLLTILTTYLNTRGIKHLDIE